MSGVFGPPSAGRRALAVLTLARHRGAADLALGRQPQPRLRGAAGRRPGDLDLADRDRRRAFFDVLLSVRERAADEAGHGEYYALLIGSVLGMVLLAEAENLVTFFVALETLSIPLYILCATNLRREGSLESGLKYLIVGSLGSATLLYGMAFIYGGTGSTDFAGIAHGIEANGMLARPADPDRDRAGGGRARLQDLDRPLPPVDARRLPGGADPDHQLHGGGDQGGRVRRLPPLLRRRPRRRRPATGRWALAILAAISIVVGNVGALGQDSLKRMLGYSGVAQAGYMLGGLVVASEKGVSSLVFYLAAYLFMNLAAFAVIVARERETPCGDDIRGVRGLGAERPALAWPLTISMLALAGLPATAGFIGKLYLIEALVEGSYTWLAVFIAVGTMISLAYYLRVVAAMWMRPDDRSRRTAPGGDTGDRRRLARSRPGRPRRRAPLVPGRPGRPRRRRHRLLRRHPAAAGRLRLPRRRLALLAASVRARLSRRLLALPDFTASEAQMLQHAGIEVPPPISTAPSSSSPSSASPRSLTPSTTAPSPGSNAPAPRSTSCTRPTRTVPPRCPRGRRRPPVRRRPRPPPRARASRSNAAANTGTSPGPRHRPRRPPRRADGRPASAT